MKIIVYKNQEKIQEEKLFDPISGFGKLPSDFFIGRDKACQLILSGFNISRFHAKIFFDKDSFYIEKISQYGKVEVNNNPILKSQIINNGDQIKINDYLLIIDDIKKIEVAQEVVQEKVEEHSFITENNELEDSHQELIDENQNFSHDNDSDQMHDFNEELPMVDDFAQMDINDGSEIGEKTQEFESFAKYFLKISGQYAPYDSYEITSSEIFIGRNSDKCQIVLKDPDVSSAHALIKRVQSRIIIQDLKSSNGTIVNGERVNEKELGPDDEILIGSTSFVLAITSELIIQESSRLMPVESGQEIEVEEIIEEEIDFSENLDENDNSTGPAQSGQGKASILSQLKDPQNRRKIIYGVFGIVLLAVVMMPEEKIENKNDNPDSNKSAKIKGSITKNDSPKTITKSNRIYTPEERETMEVAYNTAKAYFYEGKLAQAERELDIIFQLNPSGDYKQALQIKREISAANREIAALKEKKRKEEEEIKRDMEIKKLLEKANEAVKEKHMELANALINQILERDPERPEVIGLKMEMEAIIKEKERISLEEAQKKSERNRKVALLAPGKNAFLKKEWFKAIAKLEIFLKSTPMDEDLTIEGTTMLETSKKELANAINPFMEKAQSAFSGNDLLESFNNYKEVLKYDPSNKESLNKINAIQEILENRAKKIYREGLIAESLSLFDEAYEKFQEVKEVSPINTEYYNKAVTKLRNFFGEEK